MNNIQTTNTDFGYLSEMWFKPSEIVKEDFWSNVALKRRDFEYEKDKTFYIQYLHDTPNLDPQLVNKITQLFLHVYFPQEASLKEFSNPCLRCAGCWTMSELIVNYGNKVFPELNFQLLGNPQMSRTFSQDSEEESKMDPIKKKYLCHIFGAYHILGYGRNDGFSFAFDSLGIDFLERFLPENGARPLTQVFIASDNKKLQEILSHRYLNRENWLPFRVEESFHRIARTAKPLSDC